MTSVGAKVAGRVREVRFDLGDAVKNQEVLQRPAGKPCSRIRSAGA
jgi:hypothetical protein